MNLPNTAVLSRSSAWLVDIGANISIAVANKAFAEYIVEPTFLSIPGAVTYCCEVLSWRGRFVPVFDFSKLQGQGELLDLHVGVFAYQREESGDVEYVAIKLCTQTQKIDIDDGSVCDWPDDYPRQLKPLVRSLFNHSGKVVAVIDFPHLCSNRFRDHVAEVCHTY